MYIHTWFKPTSIVERKLVVITFRDLLCDKYYLFTKTERTVL